MRLLEVTETRRASGVARNAGNRRGIYAVRSFYMMRNRSVNSELSQARPSWPRRGRRNSCGGPGKFSRLLLDVAYAACNITHCVNKIGPNGPPTEEEPHMAKRKNTFTRLISDIVDDTKDLADDLLDRAKTVESNAKDAVTDAVDDSE